MQLVSLSFETQHLAVLMRASLLQLVELVALLRESLLASFNCRKRPLHTTHGVQPRATRVVVPAT